MNPRDILLGALAGVAGAMGDVLFGKAMVRSTMSVGIPLANVVAATFPAIVALAQGDQPTTLGMLGMVGALGSTLCAAWPTNGHGALHGTGYALSGGILFGMMFALLAQVHASNGAMVIAVMRFTGIQALLPGYPRTRTVQDVRSDHAMGGHLATLSGITSVAANLMFVIAVPSGPRAIPAVVAIAMASPAGLVIANLTGRERLTFVQGVSVVLAIVALVLLTCPHKTNPSLV